MENKVKIVNIRFPEGMANTLRMVAAAQNMTMTQICVDALADFFARGAMPAIDERYAHRLDRLSHSQARLEHRLTFLMEMLGTFVQHQLTLSAHLPPFETETARLGRARYDSLLETISRRVAQSKRPKEDAASPPIGGA